MRLVYDDKSARLNKRVTFRMTETERKHLERLSDKLKLNNSDLLRGLIDDEYNKVFSKDYEVLKNKNWRKK